MKTPRKLRRGKASLRRQRQFVKPMELNFNDGLCDPDHIRELIRIWEQDGQRWALLMKSFLQALNSRYPDTDVRLSATRVKKLKRLYRRLIKKGHIESLEPAQFLKNGKGKCRKKSRSQDLLDRLKECEDDIFRFLQQAADD